MEPPAESVSRGASALPVPPPAGVLPARRRASGPAPVQEWVTAVGWDRLISRSRTRTALSPTAAAIRAAGSQAQHIPAVVDQQWLPPRSIDLDEASHHRHPAPQTHAIYRHFKRAAEGARTLDLLHGKSEQASIDDDEIVISPDVMGFSVIRSNDVTSGWPRRRLPPGFHPADRFGYRRGLELRLVRARPPRP
jgi:hypothetical protein